MGRHMLSGKWQRLYPMGGESDGYHAVTHDESHRSEGASQSDWYIWPKTYQTLKVKGSSDSLRLIRFKKKAKVLKREVVLLKTKFMPFGMRKPVFADARRALPRMIAEPPVLHE